LTLLWVEVEHDDRHDSTLDTRQIACCAAPSPKCILHGPQVSFVWALVLRAHGRILLPRCLKEVGLTRRCLIEAVASMSVPVGCFVGAKAS
jgi:hypothetical protein